MTEVAQLNRELPEDEDHPENCGCDSPLFCSQTTLEALRVTLTSVMDILDLLLYEEDYDFALTGKMNQDCIEVGKIEIFFTKNILFTYSFLF